MSSSVVVGIVDLAGSVVAQTVVVETTPDFVGTAEPDTAAVVGLCTLCPLLKYP
jgi:hypothetical protein